MRMAADAAPSSELQESTAGRIRDAKHVALPLERALGPDRAPLHLDLPADPPATPRQPAGPDPVRQPRDRGRGLAPPRASESRDPAAPGAVPRPGRRPRVLEPYPRRPSRVRLARLLPRLRAPAAGARARDHRRQRPRQAARALRPVGRPLSG